MEPGARPEDIKQANVDYYDTLDTPPPERLSSKRALAVASEVCRRAGGGRLPVGPALELACGTGRLSCCLMATVILPHIVSTDISTGMLVATRELAQHNGLDVVPVRADSEQLPFRDASVSFIFGAGFLHHMVDEESFFQEVHRVLAPGGLFLIFREPQAFGSRVVDGMVRIVMFLPSIAMRMLGRSGSESFDHEQEKSYSASDLRTLGQDAGFTLVRMGGHSFFHSLHWLLWARVKRFRRPGRVFMRLAPLADAMDAVFRPVIPGPLCYEISACFRK